MESTRVAIHSEQGSEYVHVDISGDFSETGKRCVSIAWLFCIALLSCWDGCLKKRCFSLPVGWVALACTMLMLGLREALAQMGHARGYQISRHFVVQPIVFLIAMRVIAQCLRLPQHIGRVRNLQQVYLNQTNLWKAFSCSILCGVVLTPPEAFCLWSPIKTNDEPFRSRSCKANLARLAVLSGTCLGGSLVYTGSLHAMYIIYVAYDQISWILFARDLLVPICWTILLFGLLFLLLGYYCSRQEEENATEDGTSPLDSASSSTTPSPDYDSVPVSDDGGNLPTAKQAEGNDEEATEDSMSSHPEDGSNPVDEDDDARNAAIGGQNDGALFFPVTVGVLALLMLGYISNGNPPVLALSAAVILAGVSHVTARRRDNDDEEGSDFIWSQFSWDPILLVVALVILTSSLNDTGKPMAAVNMLMGDCVDSPVDQCPMYFLGVHYFLATILSPIVIACIAGATYPYMPPFFWIFLTFAFSLSHFTRLLMSQYHFPCCGRPVRNQQWIVLMLLCIGILVALPSGGYLLLNFHVSYECSERLGECGEP